MRRRDRFVRPRRRSFSDRERIVATVTSAIVLRDGRRLAYRRYGPTDGAPLLFMPGAGCGRLMTFGGAALADHQIQLISVDRPGLGASSPDPLKTFDSIADDVAALIEEVVGRPVPVVANSQGAPFGLALATTGWISALVLVSPIDDVGYPPITALLPEDYRSLVAAVARDPYPALQRLATYTPGALFETVMSDYPPSDEAVYGRPEFQTQLRAALDDGFASGATGYARDTVLAMSAWPAKLFDPGVDVRILFGADDRVHSTDLGATLADRIRGAHRDVIDGVGGALLWALPDLVLARAVATD